MGKVEGIVKWDLKTNGFRKIKTQEERKKALSVVTFGDIMLRF